jgi:molybdenum cofactor cytidylyltransferase
MINKKKNHNIKKILLAAGESKRFGDKNKLSEMINDKPIINHVLDKLLEIFDYSEILVIVGHEHKLIKNLIRNKDIKILVNIDYKKGIGTSIALAVNYLETDIDGVMIIPADMPYLNSKDLINLEKKFIELNCEKVVMPVYNSRTGNPVILPKNYFNTLKSLKDDYGAKSLIEKKDIITFKTGFGTIFDIDTRDELTKPKPNF